MASATTDWRSISDLGSGFHNAISGTGTYGNPRKFARLLNLFVHVDCWWVRIRRKP